MRVDGAAILKLTLAERGRITGSLTRTKNLSIDQDGEVNAVGGIEVSLPARRDSWKGDRPQERQEIVGRLETRGRCAEGKKFLRWA